MIPLIENHRAELEALCRKHRVRRLELFGSAATGDFNPETSDVDFLIEFDESIPIPAAADNYFGFIDAVETLFGRHVDLVEPAQIRNKYLQKSIDQTRVPLYGT